MKYGVVGKYKVASKEETSRYVSGKIVNSKNISYKYVYDLYNKKWKCNKINRINKKNILNYVNNNNIGESPLKKGPEKNVLYLLLKILSCNTKMI